jgi:hypothetical protein
LARAYRFALDIRLPGKMRQLRRLVETYLHQKEEDKYWDHLAIQHRNTLKELYALTSTKPAKERTNIVLYGRTYDKKKSPFPKGSVFEVVARLKDMAPTEAAGAIMKYRIPFIVANGALGSKAKEPELVQALIKAMSPTELVTNTKALEKLGMKTNPALRGAFDEAMAKAATSKKNTLKTTQAVDAVSDEGLKEKLRNLQEKQIKAAGGPKGSWAVLADKSGSMSRAIEASRHVSATLAKMCQGDKIYLIFFDTSPMTVDVTGLSLDQIQKATRHISANGGTSIGCALNRLLSEKIEVDGIAIVSDGAENTAPMFSDVYRKYVELCQKDLPVYFYLCDGERNTFSTQMNSAGIEMQTFDIRGGTDYYSIPNLASTMRASKYSLIDEILTTPLLSLSDVLKSKELVGA